MAILPFSALLEPSSAAGPGRSCDVEGARWGERLKCAHLTQDSRAAIIGAEARMQARIVERAQIVLAGMSFFGNPFSQASTWDVDNEIGSLWKRFLALLEASPDAIGGRLGPREAMYELHAYAPETPRTGRYEVFVGVEVVRSADIPLCCSLKIIPAGDYVLITARGREIRLDWTDWSGSVSAQCLQPAGRAASGAFVLECYDRRFKGMERIEESELDFLVPLEPAGKG